MTNKAFIYYQWNDYNLKEPPHKANNQNANETLKTEKKRDLVNRLSGISTDLLCMPNVYRTDLSFQQRQRTDTEIYTNKS